MLGIVTAYQFAGIKRFFPQKCNNVMQQDYIFIIIPDVLNLARLLDCWDVKSELLHIHLENFHSDLLFGQLKYERTNKCFMRRKRGYTDRVELRQKREATTEKIHTVSNWLHL